MRDTSPEAQQILVARLRSLAPSDRVALACQLSEELRALSADGVRHRHPELSPEQVGEAVRSIFLGAALTVGASPQEASHR